MTAAERPRSGLAGRLLLRGLLAGLLAGLLSVVFARCFGEPAMQAAIDYADQAAAAAGLPTEPALVSRAMQRGAGLATAGLIYGAALGGLLALAFAAAYGRCGRLSALALALVLAGAGFVAVVLVPQLKYPANPPGIGADASIGLRTALYFEMMFVGVAATTLAGLLFRRLAARLGAGKAGFAAAIVFVALTAAIGRILPGFNEVPPHFPPLLLWHFRIAALGMQVVLWLSVGLMFGLLAQRLLTPRPAGHLA